MFLYTLEFGLLSNVVHYVRIGFLDDAHAHAHAHAHVHLVYDDLSQEACITATHA